ncbi:WGR domain-containing protein [Stenotrophomonas sp.]|uniref:WGR domain-containing protein n=1 Tax=Stenotrophomonas sp. TaxID=69392 RepID=UPI002FC80D4E
MRVFLQHHTGGADPVRYVQLTLQPDLFGGWELLRESGQLGGRAQLRRELFLQADAARHAFEKARDTELHRGYEIRPAPGMASP